MPIARSILATLAVAVGLPATATASTPPSEPDDTAISAEDVPFAEREIDTIAGTGERGFAGDGGPARSARIDSPGDVEVGADETVYFADGDRIRAIGADGTIDTVVGGGDDNPELGADATEVALGGLDGNSGFAVADDGTIVIASSTRDELITIAPDGEIVDIVGVERTPNDVAVAPDGTVYVTNVVGEVFELVDDELRQIVEPGSVKYTPRSRLAIGDDGTIYFGDATPLVDGEVDRRVALIEVADVAVGPDGELYAISAAGLQIFAADAESAETIVADSWPNLGPLGDGGPASTATLSQPTGLAVGADGTAFVSSAYGANALPPTVCAIAVETTQCRRVLGAPGGELPDGTATTDTELLGSNPAVAIGPDDLLYVADSAYVRALDLVDGTVTVVAGIGRAAPQPFAGGRLAVDVNVLAGSLTVTPDGVVYFVDRACAVRSVDPAGIIATVAYLDTELAADECDAVNDPGVIDTDVALASDDAGNVFVIDEHDEVVRVLGDIEAPVAGSVLPRNLALFGLPVVGAAAVVVWVRRRRHDVTLAT